jgi:hypothetical protein
MSRRLVMNFNLVKTGLVWAEEAPLDVSVPEADVEHLAVGRHVGVVAVRLAVAAVLNFINILS